MRRSSIHFFNINKCQVSVVKYFPDRKRDRDRVRNINRQKEDGRSFEQTAKQMDGRADGEMDRRTNERANEEQTDRLTDIQMD
jgi:hypothetical protein